MTLEVSAKKVAVDEAGREEELPMNDLVEIGVFAGGDDGRVLHLARRRVRSGVQRVVMTVPAKPARAGIDPRNTLIDTEWKYNVTEVKVGSQLSALSSQGASR